MTRTGRTRSILALVLLAAAPLLAKEAKTRGLDREGMDTSVPPGDDFYAYANGTWMRKTEIPPDRSSTGAFTELVELTNERIAALFRDLAAGKGPKGGDAGKIADFYQSYMDEKAIEEKGLAPLRPLLDRIAAVKDRAALSRALGESVRADVDIFNATDTYTPNVLGLWVAQDLDDPSRYSPFFYQGGLGMPDREYYLDASPRMAEIREKYIAHIAAMLRLAKVEEAEVKAPRIFELERKIAGAHLSRTDSDDVAKGNNHWSRADFEKNAPGMEWTAFLEAAGLGNERTFVVWQPAAVTGLAALVASEPVGTWTEYLAFHAIAARAGVLPAALVNESFAFNGGVLSGTPKLRDRWKRGIDATNAAMGEAVGRLYVGRHFPASAKARADEMVKSITAAFRTRIDALDWMAPETKTRAKAKLAVLKVGIGYPDRWRDDSGLRVERGDAFGNAERAELYKLKTSLAKLGRPVDRSEWVMTPQTINAVNLPAMNAMNFPAAILQPPFFDPERPAAMNYGAIGAIIGHEISHSFDDQGALFDDTGRLRNWWTKEDLAHFQAAAERLVKQYDAYRPFPDLAVNGRLTLSENIADVAGIAAAYDGWRLSLGGKEPPRWEGFTGDQQLFLAYAQAWRRKSREPALRQQVLTDGHAPGPYRAATVRNIDAWYRAFDVKPGQKLALAPEERVRIW